MEWWAWTAVAVLAVAVLWALLVLVARRLPPGPLRDLVRVLPDCVTMLRTLHRDPQVPRRAKVALWVALVWVLSPVDLVPEFLPVVGPLDDVVVVVLALRYVVRVSPRGRVEAAWPGDPRLIARVLGRPRPTP